MKRRTAFLLSAPVLLVVIAASLLQLSRSRTYQVFGEIISRVQTTEPVVALTFDDGPTRQAVGALLPILRSRDVKATFFVIGRELERAPELGRQLVGEGHELANHSYSHQRMAFKSWSFIDQEIRRTDRIIRSAGYDGDIAFRPPYGKKLLLLPYYLSKHGRPTITWDIQPDSNPAVSRNTNQIVEHVLAKVRPGSIVLLHPMYASGEASLDAVGKIIDGLQQRGYRLVTVSDLMSLRSGG